MFCKKRCSLKFRNIHRKHLCQSLFYLFIRFVGSETPKHKDFENLNYISNIFQVTHNFLVLMDPVIICIYFRTINIHFRYQGERLSSHLEVTKMWFGSSIKYLSESFFADFWCREGISCWLFKTCYILLSPWTPLLTRLVLLVMFAHTINKRVIYGRKEWISKTVYYLWKAHSRKLCF